MNSARLSLGDDALDEKPPEPTITKFGIDRGRAKETVLTTKLEAHDADDSRIAFGHHETAQRISNSGNGQVARDEKLFDGWQVLDYGLPNDDVGRDRGAHETRGFVARTKALMNFPSISRETAFASRPD